MSLLYIVFQVYFGIGIFLALMVLLNLSFSDRARKAMNERGNINLFSLIFTVISIILLHPIICFDAYKIIKAGQTNK